MDEKNAGKTSDEIAVFQAYTSLITSEHETLWARHNALLLANSLIIGALAISPTALWQDKWAALAMIGAGLLISAAWLGNTVQMVGDEAACRTCRKIRLGPLQASAECARRDLCDRAQTNIHHLVLLVITVFMLMYLGLGYIRFALV